MNRGVTLVEMLVVLVIIGVTVNLMGVALGILHPTTEPFPLEVAQARERAARTGQPVELRVDSVTSVTLFPDGTVWAPAMGTWQLNPWTAEVRRVPN